MALKATNPFDNKGIGASKGPSEINPITGIPDIGHNTVNGTLGTTSEYAMDIINPAWDGIKSAMNVFNPRAYKDNGLVWNIPKSLAGFTTREAAAIKNLLGGAVGGSHKSYQNLVQDNLMDASSATLDKVPLIGPAAGNILKAVGSIAPLVWKAPSAAVDWILDKPSNWAMTKTARTGKSIPTPELRMKNNSSVPADAPVEA